MFCLGGQQMQKPNGRWGIDPYPLLHDVCIDIPLQVPRRGTIKPLAEQGHGHSRLNVASLERRTPFGHEVSLHLR